MTNIHSQEAQIFYDILGYFEKHHFLIKNCCDYFLQTFGANWATFSLTYGHTEKKSGVGELNSQLLFTPLTLTPPRRRRRRRDKIIFLNPFKNLGLPNWIELSAG